MPDMRRRSEGGVMLLGKQRTRVRRALAELVEVHREPRALARALSIREHTARFLLDGRLRPGKRTAQGSARSRGLSLAALLETPS